MDKLTIQVSTDADHRGQSLHDYLLMSFNTTLHNSSLACQRYKGHWEITLGRANPQSNKSNKSKKDWQDAVFTALAEYILEHFEEDILRGMIRKDKRYSLEETEEVLQYCRQLEQISDTIPAHKEEHAHGRARRSRLVVADLTACCEAQSFLNLDGFIRFRINKYGAELKEMIEYASDEYLMDQQYKEFISLLRYFVYIQESRIPVAHIMHKGGHEFLLLNEQMKPIDTTELDTTFKVEFLDKDYNLEDLIVSTLITIAPERVYIHTRDPELAVIKTITQIFENRTEICPYCRHCSPFLDQLGHKNQLSP
ncbi:MAG: putative sporulation protein YtxC [Paenibacillaceae bacterium]|jgi:putative sporulation protein YtxC|nr:putative sporulation protein YtxC [Paenibacillaceae bacterium]